MIGIIILLVIIIVVLHSFEKNGREKTMKKYPLIGQNYNYYGTKIHYIKKGKGEETVIFISGSGTSSPYADMYHLQNGLSQYTETIIYERPGYGWSHMTSSERNVMNLTNELEDVIGNATINNRFVFVGHSMGVLEFFSFAQKYPYKVQEIVLIDGVHPQYASQMKELVPFSIHAMKLLSNTGMLRLISKISPIGKEYGSKSILAEKFT